MVRMMRLHREKQGENHTIPRCAIYYSYPIMNKDNVEIPKNELPNAFAKFSKHKINNLTAQLGPERSFHI